MNDLSDQLNPYLVGEELIDALTLLPPLRENINNVDERLTALLDIYKIYI